MIVRAALFDLGNTLVSYYRPSEFPPILRSCLRRALRAAGISVSALDEQQLFEHALRLNKERDDLAVRPLVDRLQELFWPYADLTNTRLAEACDAFLEPIFAYAKPDVAASRVLEALRRGGVKTGIVSNTPWGSPASSWTAELARHGLLNHVDTVVFCVDVGWRKPHPAPFQRALEQLEVPASEAIFVGDDPQWDVLGAATVGLQPLLLLNGPGVGSLSCPVIERLEEVLNWITAVANSREAGSRRRAADGGTAMVCC
jgi:HAD superfamily hydrolase (TIGR01549 family)